MGLSTELDSMRTRQDYSPVVQQGLDADYWRR
jgi:hypothetical protein